MRTTAAAGYLIALAALVTMPFAGSIDTGSTRDVAQDGTTAQVEVLAAGSTTSSTDAPDGEWPY